MGNVLSLCGSSSNMVKEESNPVVGTVDQEAEQKNASIVLTSALADVSVCFSDLNLPRTSVSSITSYLPKKNNIINQ